jgi:hypothetical protein
MVERYIVMVLPYVSLQNIKELKITYQNVVVYIKRIPQFH